MTTPRTAICSGKQGGSFAGDIMAEVLADEVADLLREVGETLILPDKRVTLPSRGCLGPVRVCRPCHFRAYEL